MAVKPSVECYTASTGECSGSAAYPSLMSPSRSCGSIKAVSGQASLSTDLESACMASESSVSTATVCTLLASDLTACEQNLEPPPPPGRPEPTDQLQSTPAYVLDLSVSQRQIGSGPSISSVSVSREAADAGTPVSVTG